MVPNFLFDIRENWRNICPCSRLRTFYHDSLTRAVHQKEPFRCPVPISTIATSCDSQQIG